MNKRKLAKYVSDKTLITVRDAGIIIDVFLEGIKKSLIEGERVSLYNLGSFYIGHRKERSAINPRTQEEIIVPAKKIVKFVPSKNILRKE